jgi:transposase
MIVKIDVNDGDLSRNSYQIGMGDAASCDVDIAEIMGVPVSSVKTWIHRARSRLRELLKDFYGNE